ALCGLLVTAVSGVIVAEPFLGLRRHCIDPIVFCTACGWALALSLWQPAEPSVARAGKFRIAGLAAEQLLAIGVIAAGTGLFFYFLAEQVQYYNILALGYDDCGDYARIMYNTLHHPRELFFQVNPDRPLFFDHFQPGFLPFTLLWALWPSLNLTS